MPVFADWRGGGVVTRKAILSKDEVNVWVALILRLLRYLINICCNHIFKTTKRNSDTTFAKIIIVLFHLPPYFRN